MFIWSSGTWIVFALKMVDKLFETEVFLQGVLYKCRHVHVIRCRTPSIHRLPPPEVRSPAMLLRPCVGRGGHLRCANFP